MTIKFNVGAGVSEMQESLEHQFGVVLVTAPSKEHAETIARTLVENRLAACVSLLPMRSIYTWNGEVNMDEEWQLLIKSKLSRFTAIEAAIRAIHPYEVPEIIALPIQAGSSSYLQWIADHVVGESSDRG